MVNKRTVLSKIPCECGKVHIGETGRCSHGRIKGHDRNRRLSRAQTSAVSEHANKTGHYLLWDEVKFIDRYPHWYSRRDFTLTTSIGTVELKFLKRGCLQSDNMTTDLYYSGPLRDQFLPLATPTMLWIETHQP